MSREQGVTAGVAARLRALTRRRFVGGLLALAALVGARGQSVAAAARGPRSVPIGAADLYRPHGLAG